MAKKILIATHSQDYHALAVAEALRRRGIEPLLWYTTDYPARSVESVDFSEGASTVTIEGPEMDFAGPRPDVVWYRRVGHVLQTGSVHPADLEFAMLQCARFRSGLFRMVSPGAFWVNPPEAVERTEQKIFQHQAAVESGLVMPPTLYSNDPARIRAFLARHGGVAVYKPIAPRTWRDRETKWIPYTSLVSGERLVADELLRAAPGIYQALVPKAYELRVTFMGRRAFAAKVLSQETETGKLDWRTAYHELRMEPYDLPAPVTATCLALLDRLGLAFGCFDFIVTPDGRYVFLEVNQAGQWLFVENYTHMPLLDAFVEFLVQGRLDFDWRERDVRIRLGDVDAAVREVMRKNLDVHVDEPDGSVREEPQEAVAGAA
ncbi:MAG: hypothetical protein HY720_08805 [Planctomycetes bacterium]|nr:hypothetical protein [Planctomycetota bacterium]